MFAALLPALAATPAQAGYRYSAAQNLIVIDGAAASPSQLKAALPQAPLHLVDAPHRVWLLAANILVTNGGTLRLHGGKAEAADVDELRLKSDNTDQPGAFVSITADYGWIDIRSTRVTSWDTKAQEPDRDYDNGRAFIRARSRLRTMNLVPLQSRMDVVDSEVAYLGYNNGESYGLVWKVATPDSAAFAHVRVFGDIVDSRLHDNFFGAYSSGLSGSQWRRNDVHHNVMYGLAPHEGCDGLQVVENDVHDNGSHGITLRRHVERAVVRNNRVHDNGDSGIDLHSGPRGTIVEGNNVYANVDSGILIDSSTGNTVRNNSVHDNHLSGIQLAANASANRVQDNRISGSGVYGVEVGRGRGQRGTGDGQPRENEIVGNRIFGSGTENLHRDQPALNRYADNTFDAAGAIAPASLTDSTRAAAAPAP